MISTKAERNGVETTRTMIDDLLAEQWSMTAVNRFTQRHAHQQSPLQEKYYRDLLPLERPQTGQQYSFEVDLDKCSGCKACVTACHNLNGLESNETWRSVGLLVGGGGSAEQRTVTTACHHCVDPACLNGCPVLAYEKDPATGIVRHLDDQCIGCQYCVLKCPYDVPQYSKRLGIVRKCDMCSTRLTMGEAPACVQACPNEAIGIRVVDQQRLVATFRDAEVVGSQFLPTAPEPSYTVPTTRYLSKHPELSKLEAADLNDISPQLPHWPLVVMLVLLQAASGVFLIHAIVRPYLNARESLVILTVGAVGVLFGLVSSVFHLGRPVGAWRIFLGWRHSWLSREALVFGFFAKMAFGAPLILWWLPEWRIFHLGLAWMLAGLGLLGTFTSVMVYHDTQRPAWKWMVSGGKFYGTTCVLGLTTTISVILSIQSENTGMTGPLCLALFLGSACKLFWEVRLVRGWIASHARCLRKAGHLTLERMSVVARARNALLLTGGCLLSLVTFLQPQQVEFSVIALGMLVISEIAERYLFFTTAVTDKMPGGFR